MATSSITKNFIISSNAQAEKFLNAMEQFVPPFGRDISNSVQLKSKEDIRKLMELRKKNGK